MCVSCQNFDDIEEWNEYGELKSRLLGDTAPPTSASTITAPQSTAGLNTTVQTTPVPGAPEPEPKPDPMAITMSGLAAEAAAKASEKKKTETKQ